MISQLPLAVVPILPTLQALFTLLPLLAFSALVSLAALFRPKFLWQVLCFGWRQRGPLAVILVTVAAAIWSVRLVRQSPGPVKENTTAADWPLHRGTLVRWGAVPDAAGPTNGELRWRFRPPGTAFYSSPAVVNDAVFIIGSRGDRGRIFSIDLASGRENWSCAPTDFAATFSSAVIAGDKLFCGEGLHHTKDGRLVCVGLMGTRSGKVLWTFQTHGHIECTPCVIDNRVYFAAGPDGIYCLEFTSNGCEVVWHASGRDYTDAETSLAVSAGRVYVGLGVGGDALCVLNADDGSEIKRIPMPYPLFSPPTISAGKLFVGMGVGNYVTPLEQPAGQVCCIDLESLEVDWTFKTDGTVLGAIAATDGTLLAASADGFIYRLDALTGRKLHSWNSHSAFVSSPATDGRLVYLINQEGVLVSLDATTLEPLWERKIPGGGRFVSSPALAAGRVLVGSEHGGLRCYGDENGASLLDYWPGTGADLELANRLQQRLPAAAQEVWRYPPARLPPWQIQHRPAAVEQDLIVPVDAPPGIASLSLADSSGSLRWWSPLPAAPTQSPAAVGDNIIAIHPTADGRGSSLRVLDRDSGIITHQVALPKDSTLVADGEGFLVVGGAEMQAFDPAAKQVWSQALHATHLPALSNGMIVAVTDVPATLHLLDRSTGEYLWRAPLLKSVVSGPKIVDRHIVLVTNDGLEKRSLLDGSLRMSLPLSQLTAAILTQQWCVYTNSLGLTQPIELESLRTYSYKSANGVSVLRMLGPNGMLQVGQHGLERWDSLTGETVRFFDTQHRIDTVTSYRGRYYCVARGQGVLCLTGVAP